MATKKKPASKATAKKAAAKKPAAKKAASKKAATSKTAAKKTAAKKATAKKATANKPAAKKAAAKKAPAKKSAKKATVKNEPRKSPFGEKFIAAQKEALEFQRARYMRSAKTWKDEADSLLEGREPGDVQFDEESGEGDTLAIERERDLALSNSAQAAVDEINEALKRIEAGTYGICITSGKPIPKERLEAIPWAAERVEEKAAGFGRR